MLDRRTLLVSVAGAVFSAGGARAQAWKARHPELAFAVVPGENASSTGDRYGPWLAYLTRELGVKVTLRIANDYAAVIEGQKAGNIHIAYYGPAALARAMKVTSGGVEPFVTTINHDGTVGYRSVGYVRTDSPYRRIEDLKGRNVGFVDPNSTSGSDVPRFALDRMGIDPDRYFAKVVYTGSHENAVMALIQGTVDVAFNWWSSDSESNLSRMVNKGMVQKDAVRIIFTSELIQGAPYAYLTALPADLKQAIMTAFVEAPHKDRQAFDQLSDGKDLGFAAVTAADYKSTIELIEFVDRLRRKKPS